MNFFAVSYSKPALAQISNYVCFINIVHRSTSIQWLCLQQPWACPVTVVLAWKIASNSNLFNGSMWKRWHLSGLSVHPSDFSCWNGPQLPPAPPAAFSWKRRLKCNDDFVVHTLQVSKCKSKLNIFCNMYSDLNCWYWCEGHQYDSRTDRWYTLLCTAPIKNWWPFCSEQRQITVRPRDTRPRAARTSQVHVFELVPKICEVNEFM